MNEHDKLLKMMKADHIINGDEFYRKTPAVNDIIYVVNIDKFVKLIHTSEDSPCMDCCFYVYGVCTTKLTCHHDACYIEFKDE